MSEHYTSRDEVEGLRASHLRHEASIKTIGALLWFGGIVFLIVAGVSFFVPDMVNSGTGESQALDVILGTLVIALLHFWLGSSLRRLDHSARYVTALLCVIGLLAIPIGTIINAYFLYLLFSAKGQMIFSDTYKEVILQTPNMKHRTSKILWIFLILSVILIAGLILWTTTLPQLEG